MARKPKYQPRHEWVSSLKLKGSLAEILDSMTDHIGKLLDGTNMRDWIYLMTYLSAVYLAYITIKKVKMTFPVWIGMVIPLIGTLGLLKGEPIVPPITTEEFDWETMAQAMVTAYIVLKIDMADLSSAVTKITGVVSALGVAG